MLHLITTALLAVSLNSPAAVQDYIHARAIAYSYSPVKAEMIADCESNFISGAKNKHSSASGVFMFIDSTWQATMKEMGLPTTTPKTDPHYNIEAGLYRLDKYGDGAWAASQHCWQPKYIEYLNSYADAPLAAS